MKRLTNSLIISVTPYFEIEIEQFILLALVAQGKMILLYRLGIVLLPSNSAI
jgi:hypothetical protein